MPSACARSADITTAAAAPSDVCDELPAVTVPLRVEGRLQLRQRLERRVGARAFVHLELDLRLLRLRLARRAAVNVTGTGTISSLELPGGLRRERLLVAGAARTRPPPRG